MTRPVITFGTKEPCGPDCWECQNAPAPPKDARARSDWTTDYADGWRACRDAVAAELAAMVERMRARGVTPEDFGVMAAWEQAAERVRGMEP